ncbi:MAG: LacI family DNA-binding transcriptional regulator [Bacillota bacterium]|jgi:LacI family transcriptional regulator
MLAPKRGVHGIATIYDVAKKVGVSTATVSRALSNSGYVRKDLKEQIQQVARAMDYQPNSLARGLVTKESHILGLIMPDISNPFFPAIARGVEDVANENGYNVLLCNTDGSSGKETDYINVLRSRQADGVIFTTSQVNPKNARILIDAGIPVVLADRRMNIACDSVVAENVGGAYRAVRHLLDLGHTRIGIISGPMGVATSDERIEGYKRALLEGGVAVRDDLIREGNYRQHSGYECTCSLLELPDPPTAVFACNDLMAVGALSALEDRGLRAPDDVAVVGYDDITIASVTRPKLTTVAQPKYEMGAIACRMLIERLKNPGKPYQSMVLASQLIVRESSVVMTRTPRRGED